MNSILWHRTANNANQWHKIGINAKKKIKKSFLRQAKKGPATDRSMAFFVKVCHYVATNARFPPLLMTPLTYSSGHPYDYLAKTIPVGQ